MFVTEALPKGATGKIQRRFMADAFLGTGKQAGRQASREKEVGSW